MRLSLGLARLLRVLVLLTAFLAVLAPSRPVLAHEGDDTTTTVAPNADPIDAGEGSEAVPALTGSNSGAASEAGGLASSWPRDGVMLWVPPKEGRLTFAEPVKSSTLTIAVRRDDGEALVDDDVVRLTSGESVTEILLRLPPLRPGMYALDWSVAAVSGTSLTGSVEFGLEPPVAAVGGQNHRHGESHLYEDTIGQFALRLLFVASVAFLFAAVRRTRAFAGKGAVERLFLRVGAALLLFAALLAGVVDVAAWVDEYHDEAFSAIVAAPGLSLLIPVLAFSVFSLVRPRPTMPVFWCGVGVLGAYAGLSHAIRTALGAELFVVFTVLLAALALLWAELLRVLTTPLAAADAPAAIRSRVLVGSVAVLVLTSFSMLVLHAGTFALEMAFFRDFRSRVALSVLLAAALGVFMFTASRRRLRLLAAVPAVVIVVVSALLAWMPPPAAGL